MLVYQRVNQLILSAEVNLLCQLQKQENLQETKARPARIVGSLDALGISAHFIWETVD